MLSDSSSIESAITSIISAIGEDVNREGLLDTPKRVARAYTELFSGYSQDPKEILRSGFKEGSCKEMVVLRNIEFSSFCEHHMLPFFGHVSVGYLPNGSVVGISKIARVVDCFAKRLQIQERMTSQVADAMMEVLAPHGVMVVVDAQHFCITNRGIRKQDAIMTTSAVRGQFLDEIVRREFLAIVRYK